MNDSGSKREESLRFLTFPYLGDDSGYGHPEAGSSEARGTRSIRVSQFIVTQKPSILIY